MSFDEELDMSDWTTAEGRVVNMAHLSFSSVYDFIWSSIALVMSVGF